MLPPRSSHGHRLRDAFRSDPRAPGYVAGSLGRGRLHHVQEELVGRNEAGAHVAYRGPLRRQLARRLADSRDRLAELGGARPGQVSLYEVARHRALDATPGAAPEKPGESPDFSTVGPAKRSASGGAGSAGSPARSAALPSPS